MDLSFKEVAEITVKRFGESSLGKSTESKNFNRPMSEYDKPISFTGSSERDRLERDLASAKWKLESSGKALEGLLKDKADGWIGVDSNIGYRKNEVADATSQIRDLTYKLSNLKD